MSDNTNDEKDVAKLQAALKAERAAHKETADKLKESEASLSAASTKLAESATLANPNAEGLAKLVADSAKALTAKETAAQQAKIAELEAALETERKGSADLLGKLASRTIRDEVMEAARAAFVRQEALADVVTMASLELKLKGDTVQTADGASVAEWIDAAKASRPFWWPLSRGAGARGSSEYAPRYDANDNPFKSGPGFNLTRAGQILSTDPERAKHLQQLAGT